MHDHKVLITCKSQLDSMALLAIPKIGSWNLNDLVKDPNGNEFQEFLQHTETIIDEVEESAKTFIAISLHRILKTYCI
jgi:hypothetical protein